MNAVHDEEIELSNAIASEPWVADVEARVEQALQELRSALDSGEKIDRAKLLSKYHDVEKPLAACLKSLDLIADLAPQMAASIASALLDKRLSGDVDRLPACLGDYRLIRPIGMGGMGIVFEAEQISRGRRVALKVLPFAAMLDKTNRQRFKNEARLAGMLDHPNIVPVYAVGVERGFHYYAMQYIEGRSLAETLEELRRLKKIAALDAHESQRSDDAGLPDSICPKFERKTSDASRIRQTATKDACGAAEPTRSSAADTLTDLIARNDRSDKRSYVRVVAEYGIQIARALAYAHEKGVVHRDIKPANLLLDAHGKVWITDFGLARLDRNGTLTTPGYIVGTLRYMSPEQALASPVDIDGRSDIYSLGATLYELLTLQPAFVGEDRWRLLDQIVSQKPIPPRQLDGQIPCELETVVLKALEKDPHNRYATAYQMAEDLRCFLECISQAGARSGGF